MEDEKIIGLFFARDQQAIQELNQKYGKLFHALALRILNDRRDAEECVNDAYLGVWNAIPPQRPQVLSAYVCRIVRNLALKAYARNTAARRNSAYDVAMGELESCLPAPGTVERELEARELVRVVEGFLDTLSRENRVIFLRRYWFADSYEDIARQVGLSEKAVSVRLSRLREKLRQYLMEQEVFV